MNKNVIALYLIVLYFVILCLLCFHRCFVATFTSNIIVLPSYIVCLLLFLYSIIFATLIAKIVVLPGMTTQLINVTLDYHNLLPPPRLKIVTQKYPRSATAEGARCRIDISRQTSQ